MPRALPVLGGQGSECKKAEQFISLLAESTLTYQSLGLSHGLLFIVGSEVSIHVSHQDCL